MKNFKIIFLIFLSVISGHTVTAQAVCSGESIELRLDIFRGTLIWQQSNDNVNFTDIAGATSSPYYAVITSNKFFRAKVVEGSCQPVYSEVKTITLKDPSLCVTTTPSSVCDNLPPGVFCDDFNGTTLDLTKWWYGRRQWGINNHGVIPENVQVKDGKVFIAGNGDNYTGPYKGVRKTSAGYIQDQPGTRTGGLIITDQYFGSGSYEVRMKLPKSTGVVSAIWTFHYQEVGENQPGYQEYINAGNYRYGDATNGYYVIPNHEIDIEIPTALKGEADSKAAYTNARFNTWIGETATEYTDFFKNVGFNMSDGQFHTYRIDWHTGPTGKRVDFYIDGVLKQTNTTDIPYIKGRLTIGTWYADWAGGSAPYATEYLEIDWVKITPYNEAGDVTKAETFPNDGMTKCPDKASNDLKLPACLGK